MGADLDLPERESVRTPMQWSDNRNAGFSTADADELYHPVVDEGRYGYQSINVADQLREQDSLLNRIRRLVDARTLCTELSSGDFSIVDVEPKEVWVHRVDHGRTTLLTAHNLAAEPRTVTVDFDAPADATTRVVGPGDYEVDAGRATFDLDATEYAWLRGDRHGERVPLGSP
jgi:maltose alpha-D-glucosyltransferase/alpha-amylase